LRRRTRSGRLSRGHLGADRRRVAGAVIVLDTHALLWWTLDPKRLSATASATIREMEERGGFASSISIWELGTKVKRGKLELPIGVDELARRIERGAVVELL